MNRTHPYWGPAIAITEETRDQHQRGLAELRAREAAQRIEALLQADQQGRKIDLNTEG